MLVGAQQGGYVLAPELVSSELPLLASDQQFVRVFLLLRSLLPLLFLAPTLAAPGGNDGCHRKPPRNHQESRSVTNKEINKVANNYIYQ